MKKQETGITLISLVISVIVMLVLAGVAINLSIGDNGIFKKASQGTNLYEEMAKKEQSDLESLYSQIRVAQDSQVTLTMEQLNEYINNKVDEKLNDIKNTMVSKEEYEQVVETVGRIRSGTATVGVISANSVKNILVTFKEPLDTDQYSVAMTFNGNGTHYSYVGYKVNDKTVNGFTILLFNTKNESTGSLALDYTVIPYTE